MTIKNPDASLENHKEVLSKFSDIIKTEPAENQKKEKKELEEFLAMLDEAIEDLKNAEHFPGFRERDKLVGLSHLALWDEATKKENLKFELSNKEKLLDEAKWFRLYIGKPDSKDM